MSGSGFDARFNIPSNLMVVGPTSCGKTSWLKKLLKNKDTLFSSPVKYMLLFYKEWQPAYTDMQHQINAGHTENFFLKFASVPETVEEMKELLEVLPKNKEKIVVFDDYLDEVGLVLKHFFTVLTHHYNCFTIFLCQNLFSAKNDLRTLSINSQYMALFNNPRDRSAITHLAKQVFPGNAHVLNEAYRMATNEKPYGYILLDFHQRQSNLIRIRSHIFPDEYPIRVYNTSF